MNIAYFEDAGWERLLPLTWLRAAFELRCGCDRLIDKARRHLRAPVAHLFLRAAVRATVGQRIVLDSHEAGADWCLLNARALVTRDVPLPSPGLAWHENGEPVAAAIRAADLGPLTAELFHEPARLEEWLRNFRLERAPDGVRLIAYPWELPLSNEDELRRQLHDAGQQHGEVYLGAQLVQPGRIRIDPGARVKPGAVLDAEDGPIWIAENALIDANAVVQGPCYVGPGSTVRPGALISGGTTIGPVCKIGGEVKASIIHGYSNKQHDGFLGHSYVGPWVNLGADTVTSDLKNTYGAIRVAVNGVGVESGQHFVGAFIGDHAKTGIGTVLPTGGVVGVAANVFTQRPVPKFVPSFAWLTDAGLSPCRVDKAEQIARTVMGRREVELSDAECELFRRTAELARQVEAAGWATGAGVASA